MSKSGRTYPLAFPQTLGGRDGSAGAGDVQASEARREGSASAKAAAWMACRWTSDGTGTTRREDCRRRQRRDASAAQTAAARRRPGTAGSEELVGREGRRWRPRRAKQVEEQWRLDGAGEDRRMRGEARRGRGEEGWVRVFFFSFFHCPGSGGRKARVSFSVFFFLRDTTSREVQRAEKRMGGV